LQSNKIHGVLYYMLVLTYAVKHLFQKSTTNQ
jgi:hypothetical protein